MAEPSEGLVEAVRVAMSEGPTGHLADWRCEQGTCPTCRRYIVQEAAAVLAYLRAHPEDSFMVEVRAAAQQAEADRWITLMVNALALNQGEIDRDEFRRRCAGGAA